MSLLCLQPRTLPNKSREASVMGMERSWGLKCGLIRTWKAMIPWNGQPQRGLASLSGMWMGHPVEVLGGGTQIGSEVGWGRRDIWGQSLEPDDAAGRREINSKRRRGMALEEETSKLGHLVPSAQNTF